VSLAILYHPLEIRTRTLLCASPDLPKSLLSDAPDSTPSAQAERHVQTPHYQHSSYMGTDGRPLTTMPSSSPRPHFLSTNPTQFIIKTPVHFVQSSSPIYSSISSRLPTVLLQFLFHPSILTQIHAHAAEPYGPQSFTFDPAHVQLMHGPFSESAPPQLTASRFLILPSPSCLRSMLG